MEARRMSAHTPLLQAKVVRDALKALAAETYDPRTMTAAASLANADDATLAKLGRLIR